MNNTTSYKINFKQREDMLCRPSKGSKKSNVSHVANPHYRVDLRDANNQHNREEIRPKHFPKRSSINFLTQNKQPD